MSIDEKEICINTPFFMLSRYDLDLHPFAKDNQTKSSLHWHVLHDGFSQVALCWRQEVFFLSGYLFVNKSLEGLTMSVVVGTRLMITFSPLHFAMTKARNSFIMHIPTGACIVISSVSYTLSNVFVIHRHQGWMQDVPYKS